MSKHCQSQYDSEYEYSNVNNHVYDQSCRVQAFSRGNADCKVLSKNFCNNASTDIFVDRDKAFDLSEFQHVSNDTVTDLICRAQSNMGYKTQRQTNIPCYSYDNTPCHVNYLYGDTESLGILALQCCDSYVVFGGNESAVSQYCKVIVFECLNDQGYMFSPVIYIHADKLEHRWYEYRSGYYELHGWYPIESSVLSPLTVAYVCQAYLQLFHQDYEGFTLSPHQAYENYCKDLQLSQYYGCSYEQYMNQIIDTLVDFPGFDSNEIPSESPIMNIYGENARPPLKVGSSQITVSGRIDESQGDPPVGGVGFGSPNRGDNKF